MNIENTKDEMRNSFNTRTPKRRLPTVPMNTRLAVFVDGVDLLIQQRQMKWKIDPNKLKRWIGGLGAIVDATYYTLDDGKEAAEGFHRALVNMGYRLVKKVSQEYTDDTQTTIWLASTDVECAIDAISSASQYDVAVLVTGNPNFRSLIEALRARGKGVIVISDSELAGDLIQLVGGNFVEFRDIQYAIRKEKNPDRERLEHRPQIREKVAVTANAEGFGVGLDEDLPDNIGNH